MRSAIILICFVIFAGCATSPPTSAPKVAVQPKLHAEMQQVTMQQILDADYPALDLNSLEIVCHGQKRQMVDYIDKVVVKGVLCSEGLHMGFMYLFNEEPFFFAITLTNPEHDELRPLVGYGAFKKKRYMSRIDLKSPPRLPAWAYDSTGNPIKSIYEDAKPAR